MPPTSNVELHEADEAVQAQVQADIGRILASDTFRNSEALRRLLRFLADRMAAGEADQLNEYSVGTDGLGKSQDYDPRHHSAVRIQVGRLRQKLAEYYRSEGLEDRYVVELPKGSFKLRVTPRPAPAETPVEQPHHRGPAAWPLRFGIWIVISTLAIAAVAWALVATAQLRKERQESEIFRSGWTAELAQLWAPFLSPERPVIVAIEDPPFVQFDGAGTYREMNLNTWEDIQKSPRVQAIRKVLGNPEMTQNNYYAPVGEVSAAFLLGRFLGSRVHAISVSGVRELNWPELASHNVIYVGASVFFTTRFEGLPVPIDLNYGPQGITNAHPKPGELALYPEPLAGPTAAGERYAIVTHVPGPAGSGEVTSFTSMRTPSRLGAVQWFTDPAHAGELIAKMKNAAGQLPRYYQVLLRVKFEDSVPTESFYVLHHELTAPAGANPAP